MWKYVVTGAGKGKDACVEKDNSVLNIWDQSDAYCIYKCIFKSAALALAANNWGFCYLLSKLLGAKK